MILNTTIGIIGGDSRQLHMAVRLLKSGYKVRLTGFDLAQLPKGLQNYTITEILSECTVLILPLPVSRDEKILNASFSEKSIPLQTLMQEIPPNTHICPWSLDAKGPLCHTCPKRRLFQKLPSCPPQA